MFFLSAIDTSSSSWRKKSIMAADKVLSEVMTREMMLPSKPGYKMIRTFVCMYFSGQIFYIVTMLSY